MNPVPPRPIPGAAIDVFGLDGLREPNRLGGAF